MASEKLHLTKHTPYLNHYPRPLWRRTRNFCQKMWNVPADNGT